jgi:beta-lactamase superfamily II metal-dependent hydrolase
MKVTVFNVEHGACSFITTPNGHAVMIDAGCTQGFSPIHYLVPRDLKTATKWENRALTELIITHPHEDHINDIETIKQASPPALLLRQRYNWEDVKVSEDGEYEKLDIYAAWQNTYNGTPVTLPVYGMDIKWFCLTPDEAKKIDEAKFINNSSMVVVATVTGTKGDKFTEKFLFGGDVETAGWEALLAKNNGFKEAVKNTDFFIPSHHGHKSGFSQALFDAMGKSPILNIVSIHNNDEHIDEHYKLEGYASGTKINGETRRQLTTRCDGTITIHVTDEGKYWVGLENIPDNRESKLEDWIKAIGI